MQLLLIRHALPLPSTDGADPDLSDLGREQAARLPDALAPHGIVRIVSSPQRRALDTAAPLAAALGLDVDVRDGLAEYDRDHAGYLPIEQAREQFPEQYARIKAGYLPDGVDADAFAGRVEDALARVIGETDPDASVAVVAHGGVVNAVLHRLLGTATPLTFPIDYCSITRVLVSRSGHRTVASVNETQHVLDLLPRYRMRSSSTSQ